MARIPWNCANRCLGLAPERLNAVDVPGSLDELIVAVVDPKVLFQADVNQAIVARPTIGMNDAVGVNFASNNGLQRSFGGIGHDFCVDAVSSFEQAKDNNLATCATPTLAANTSGTKVGFIGFKLACKGRAARTVLRHAQANALINIVGAA